MFLARALLMIVESRTSGASLVWTQALYTCFACQSLSGGKLIYASQVRNTMTLSLNITHLHIVACVNVDGGVGCCFLIDFFYKLL
jgi:hypothetical protein